MAQIDEIVKTRFQNDKHRLMANLVFTTNWMKTYFTNALKPYDLSMQQFNILRILRGNGDWVAMNDIKNLMIEKSPNATRLADKLMEKGYVERRRSDTDRRVVYLKVSKKGLELLLQIDEDDHFNKSFIDRITHEEAKQVNEVLNKLRE